MSMKRFFYQKQTLTDTIWLFSESGVINFHYFRFVDDADNM